MLLSEIHVYPLKSGSAVSLEEVEVHRRGLNHDRRWVIIDDQGQFQHQRIRPQLATVVAEITESATLRLVAPGRTALVVPLPDGRQRCQVTVWQDQCSAADAGDDAAKWLTEFLGYPCRLAFMDADAVRPVDPQYAQPGDVVSFADAAPLLLTTTASLDDLNRRLPEDISSVPMNRFRSNLVIAGAEAWAEDEWQLVKIGSVEFELTHGCQRCVATTIDQATGSKTPGGEPLRTLATFRKEQDGVYFGQNLIPRTTGTLRVGDELQVLQTRSE